MTPARLFPAMHECSVNVRGMLIASQEIRRMIRIGHAALNTPLL